ncbi:MAG: hypothetical protein NTZ54_12530 [Alphaproteobacteria bacterium]|nr:hypothetical protein [Alphaproteobacteria bacterium]
MRAADVIEVTMRADGGDRPLGKCGNFRLEWPKAHAAVDKQVSFAAVDQPHVAAHPGRHVAFEDPAEAIVDPADFIPFIARNLHQSATSVACPKQKL